MEAIIGGTVFSLMMSAAPLWMLTPGTMPEPGEINRAGAQIAVMIARSGVELSYDAIHQEEGSNITGIRGLRVIPPESAGLPGCVIEMEALTLAPHLGETALRLRIEADDVTATPACAGPNGLMFIGMLGPQALNVTHLAGTISYGLPESTADVQLFLESETLGTVDAALALQGLHIDPAGDEPMPGGRITLVELTLQEVDTLRALLPLIGGPDPADAASEALEAALADVATKPAGKELIATTQTEITRLIEDGGSVTLRSAAGIAVPFRALAETDGPEDLVPLLRPTLSATPSAVDRLIGGAQISAAIAGAEDVPEGEQLRIARALAAGAGAPKAPAQAATIFARLAEAGNADAALALAALRAEADSAAAYALALDAGASGAQGARLLLDSLESGMDFAAIIDAQGSGERAATDPAADIIALRRQARTSAQGEGVRRSYADAYYLGLLASAAGDRASSALVGRIEDRFGEATGWAAFRDAQSERALAEWTDGLGEALGAP